MYKFKEDEVYFKIYSDWKHFAEKLNLTKMIIGISGGIDSTTCAALACKIFGERNVYGVSMPRDQQHDIEDVNMVFDELKINRLDFNIGDAFHSIIDGIENNAIQVSAPARINLPARIRMATLYAFAQSLEGIVINTCNKSESVSGYDTLFGDDAGSYAPIQDLTKTEVRKLASWLGVSQHLVSKTPIDGLQGNTDEQNFGYTYEDLDKYIRFGVGSKELISKVIDRYEHGGKFKMEIIHLEGPKFDFPNYIQKQNLT